VKVNSGGGFTKEKNKRGKTSQLVEGKKVWVVLMTASRYGKSRRVRK
jgi:hypothetical protein